MAFSKKVAIRPLIFLLGGMAFFYLLYHSFMGGTLFARNWYDSYSIQAENWLAGHTYLTDGEQYTWLEIAYYNGQYYLSFPPVPSVFMLPWVVLCGSAAAVPANFVIACWALLTAAGVYLLFSNCGASAQSATFWALFVTMGSNVCWLSTSGGVWFMAQVCNLCLVVWGLLFASMSHKATNVCAAICLALAVGCRPFSILLLALFFLYIWLPECKKSQHPLHWGNGFWPAFCLAALIGGVIAWYNVVRFGSILEFGHNYLPEFIEASYGQFHWRYFWPNLVGLFSPITLSDTFVLEFSNFNGFFLFAANPIFLLWLIYTLKRVAKRQFCWQEGVLWGCWLLGLAFLCLHKTMGGWQFGVRYMVDLIPYTLLCALVWLRQTPNTPRNAAKSQPLQIPLAQGTLPPATPSTSSTTTTMLPANATPADWAWFLLALAVMFNIYGALYLPLL